MVGNIDSAYFYLNELSILKDSITNNSVLQRVAEMKGKFDFEQEMNARKADQALKDAISAKELEREKLLRNIFLIGFFLLLFSAGLFFYQRNKISKEKRRSDDLLLNILPAETAEELKQKGSAEAKLFDLATVIFTDFKGFTELSEKLSPAQLVSEIHSYFSAFDTIMEKHGIEKIKTIGDSYMAASGLPTPTLKSTRNAVMAALEMFAYLKIRQQSAGIPVFEMRCGLHTGPIVAGIVGIKKFQYDIWGDTVNTASRIENNGEVGKVNISRATYELLKNDESFVFEPRGKISVKGKGDLKMYYVSLKS
jgi:class 3 adenylate cyclase